LIVYHVIRELVLEKVLSTGSNGIKKSDLKKQFTSFDLDQTLENLINDGKYVLIKRVRHTIVGHQRYISSISIM
jgi:hypothetical protein